MKSLGATVLMPAHGPPVSVDSDVHSVPVRYATFHASSGVQNSAPPFLTTPTAASEPESQAAHSRGRIARMR